MPRKKAIPDEVREIVVEIVEHFNKTEFKKDEAGKHYIPKFKGKFLYLDRMDNYQRKPAKMCRLKYTGDVDNWDFSIFLYSREIYSDEEFFPGSVFVDGTIEGAMKACLTAYPD
jgi:hypothetical protein